MIRKIISIAALYLRTTYTSRSTLLFLIAMPLVFTFIFALTMKSMVPPMRPTNGNCL